MFESSSKADPPPGWKVLHAKIQEIADKYAIVQTLQHEPPWIIKRFELAGVANLEIDPATKRIIDCLVTVSTYLSI